LTFSFASVSSALSSCRDVAMTRTLPMIATMIPGSKYRCEMIENGSLRQSCFGGGSTFSGCIRNTLLHISAHSFCSSVRSIELVCDSIRIREN